MRTMMIGGILVKICFWVGVYTIMDKGVIPLAKKLTKKEERPQVKYDYSYHTYEDMRK